MCNSVYFPNIKLKSKYYKFKVDPLYLGIARIQFEFDKFLHATDEIQPEFSMTFKSKDPTLRVHLFKFGYEKASRSDMWRCYMETTSKDDRHFFVETKLLSTDELVRYGQDMEFLPNALSFIFETCP